MLDKPKTKAPQIIFYGSLLSSQPSRLNLKGGREWAEHQVIANILRDDEPYRPMWPFLILPALLILFLWSVL